MTSEKCEEEEYYPISFDSFLQMKEEETEKKW